MKEFYDLIAPAANTHNNRFLKNKIFRGKLRVSKCVDTFLIFKVMKKMYFSLSWRNHHGVDHMDNPVFGFDVGDDHRRTIDHHSLVLNSNG